MSTKLKADLMGFEMVELSHGSVTSTTGPLAAMTVCSSEGLYSLNQLLKLIIQQLAVYSLFRVCGSSVLFSVTQSLSVCVSVSDFQSVSFSIFMSLCPFCLTCLPCLTFLVWKKT